MRVNALAARVPQEVPMWTYHPELLATPVPRYTSYPTAAEFHGGIGAGRQAEGLAQVGNDEPISLYVHIPYCREICWYCGCNTGAANRTHRLANYLARLNQEIDLVARRLDGRGSVQRIAFGGGSPNAIEPAQFTALVDHIRAAFGVDATAIWSVEVDPRGFDQPFADALEEAGVTRASIGVQTFNTEVQRAIGRNQPIEVIAKAAAMLRAAGITSLNFDLMYGLPHQTTDVLLDSVALSEQMGADRLAVFGYAHVPHLIPRQRKIDQSALPNARTRFEQAAAAHEFLVAHEWRPVGFDHFARADDPLAIAASQGRVRRNFQGFTDDPCDTLIGLGASSISRLPGALVQNEKNAGQYGLLVGNGLLPATRGIALSEQERRRARKIEQLLCAGTADLAGLPDLPTILGELEPFAQAGLIALNDTRLDLLPDAVPYARGIAARLDPWRTVSGVKFSSAV